MQLADPSPFWASLPFSPTGAQRRAVSEILADMAGQRLEVDDFAVEAGRGTRGNINGQALILGNHRWVHERGHCSPALEARMAEHERLGRSISILADEQGVLALLIVADAIKPSSRQAVQEMHAQGITPVMLTGDNLQNWYKAWTD